ncbi:hypothetical protein ACQ4PT_036026 [Festuca glaucescens]
MEAQELLKKLRALEEGQAELEREIGRLVPEAERRGGARPTARRRRRPPPAFPSSSSRRAIAAFPHPSFSSRLLHRARLSDRHCHWILQSLGQAVHIIAPDGKLLYCFNSSATKVTSRAHSRVRTGHNCNVQYGSSCEDQDSEHEVRAELTSSEASTPNGDVRHGVFVAEEKSPGKSSKTSDDSGDGKVGFHKMFSSKAEGLLAKKGIPWPWKGRENDGGSGKNNVTSTPLHDKQENDRSHQRVPVPITIPERQDSDYVQTSKYEDVAVKLFSSQEYSEEMINTFRQEVSLMKKLRHPNIILFMGAVASQRQLCIVTEFLPRGSLFRLLQKNTGKLDPRRRVNMAIDIARGMNYLHNSIPTVVHRDLKSSNLLVDKNWTVKVADFGLSRVKLETFLTTKTGKGTPQWMAPEVLRSEPSNEKSDVYSYGVVLWELVAQKIPWDTLNTMQVRFFAMCTYVGQIGSDFLSSIFGGNCCDFLQKVIGAVGFMDQRLEIPSNTDPEWASIIESCWDSDPQRRPSFRELLERLQELQKQYAAQAQTQRKAAGKGAGKMSGEDC